MIELQVNNESVLGLSQYKQYGSIGVTKTDKHGNEEYGYEIPAGDMVMLLNYYRYMKQNDYQCYFINPTGKNSK